MRAFLLFVHIVAVGAWLGGNVTKFVVTPAMQKTGGAPAAAWMRETVRMGTRIYTPAAAIILITGLWLVVRSDVFDFEHAFVSIGMITVIVGAVLGMRVFGPGGRKVADQYDAGDTAGTAASHRRLAMFGALDTALVAFTIWAMIKQLGV